MDYAAERLLNIARSCYERGEMRMADRTLKELEQRGITEEGVGPELFEEYRELCEKVPDLADIEASNLAESADTPCEQCQGTKKFRGGKCIACNGKGYQNTHDLLRRQSYVARRKAIEDEAERFANEGGMFPEIMDEKDKL